MTKSTSFEFFVRIENGHAVDPDNKLTDLKKFIKKYNQRIRQNKTIDKRRLRVKLAGRLGPNHPAANQYKNPAKVNTIRLSDATYAAVYVYYID